MNVAYSLSFRSSCVKRKVGAVITNADGYIIGAGWNTVSGSQVPCGLGVEAYMEKLTGWGREGRECSSLFSPWYKYYKKYKKRKKSEVRCDANEGAKDCGDDLFCAKDECSREYLQKKLCSIEKGVKKAIEEFDGDLPIKCEKFVGAILDIQKNKIKRMEFCRSLHAEENAILQAAKYGGMGVKGSVLYTTTFPCELCAKKIYHTGISKIVYTEPYPGGKSKNLFLKDGVRSIRVKQFEGVRARGFYRFFKSAS